MSGGESFNKEARIRECRFQRDKAGKTVCEDDENVIQAAR
jgi:hypothetical protein